MTIRNNTREMIGSKVRAYDFEPRPGDRPDYYVEGEVVDYIADRDLLVISVTKDTIHEHEGAPFRHEIYTPPFGHMMFDEDPIVEGHKRIEVIA